MTKLLSGRIAKVPSANVSSERYQFIELSEVEPDLGLPSQAGQVVASDAAGNRYWIRLDTANVAELNNLYFTNARVLAALATSNVQVNNLTISGDLLVQGNTVILNTASLSIEDKNILLANGAPNASAADGAGITIAGANASIIYTSNGDKFTINKDVEILGNTLFGGNITFVGSNVQGITTITATETILVKNVISDSITANIWNRLYTSNVVETTNQYFTNVRVLQVVNPLLTTANVIESASNLYYTNARVYVAALDAVNPRLTTANVTELDNLYYTNSRVISAVNPLLTTSNVIEGANLYFTNTRAYVAAIDAVNPRLTTANVVELTNLYFTNVRTIEAITPLLTTSNVAEGTNQYFTNARVLAALATANTQVNNLTVSGDLLVQGNTTTLNVGTLLVEDKNIVLANGSTSAAVADGAGITIEGANAIISYASSGDKITVNKNFEITGNLSVGSTGTSNVSGIDSFYSKNITVDTITANTWNRLYTANVTELNNLYYTDARVNTAVHPMLTTANVIESSSNLYYTNARVNTAVRPMLTTANVIETGGNLYFANTRVYDALSDANVTVGNLFVRRDVVIAGNLTIGVGPLGTISDIGNIYSKNITVDVITSNIWNGLYTANVIESTNNLYFTNARVNTAVRPMLTTANVTESASNLYYTNARSRASLSSGLGINYDSTTGVISANITSIYTDANAVASFTPYLTTANVIEATSNLYFTNARAVGSFVAGENIIIEANGRISAANVVSSYSIGTIIGDITTANVRELGNLYYTDTRVNTAVQPMLTTANVKETTNLYFTNARARAAITGGTGVSVDWATGVVSIGQNVSTTSNVTFGSVTILGNLYVLGNSITFSTNTFIVDDTLIQLGITNPSDALDIGFIGHYNDGSERHSGIIRDHASKKYFVFDNYSPDPGNDIQVSNAATEIRYSTLVAKTFEGNVLGTVSSLANHTTSNLAEGTNLYYTDARVNTAVRPMLTTANVIETGGNFYYTNAKVYAALSDANVTVGNLFVRRDVIIAGNLTVSLGNLGTIYDVGNIFTKNIAVDVITANIWNRLYTSNVIETTNQYFTNVRVLQAVNPLLTTANVVENSGILYFTPARARESLSSGSGITYDSATGVISANVQAGFSAANAITAITPLLTTANVIESASNLYYTNARVYVAALDAVNPRLTTSNVTELTNLYFTNVRVLQAVNPLLTSANVIESASNLYYTNARVYVAALDAVNPRLTTANVTELTNQYFTNVRVLQVVNPLLTTANVVENSGYLYFTSQRARESLSAGSGIAYDSTTGVISANTSQYFDANALAAIIPLLTTANVVETTNKYFTNTRVLDALATSNVLVNSLTISGDLVVQGNTVTLNTGTLNVEDKNLLLGNGLPNAAAADGAGITIDGANAILTYAFSGNKITVNKAFESTGNIVAFGSISAANWNNLYTSNVIESSGNLYFTDARAITAVNPRLTTANVTELTNLYYTNARVNSFVQPFLTTANVIETAGNLYFTNARVYSALSVANVEIGNLTVRSILTVGSGTSGTIYNVGNIYVTNAIADSVTSNIWNRLYTANVIETSGNLYFTTSRARTSLSSGLGITYDSTTGIISANVQAGYTDANVNATVRPMLTTANVIESASNLYYTNARVLNALVTSDLLANGLTLAGQLRANGLIIRNISVADSVLAGNVTGSSVTGNTIVTDSITANIWNRLYTANVIETSGNLYFTNARVVSALSAGQYIVLASNGQISANITSVGGTTINNSTTNFVYSGNITAAAYIEFNESQVISIVPAVQSYNLARQVADAKNIMVIQDGLVQIPFLDYTVSGNVLTLTETVASNSNVEVRYFGLKAADYIAPSLLATVNTFVGDGNTSYTLSLNPVSKNYLAINIDGVIQLSDTYDVSSSTLTFTEAPPLGANIDVRIWSGIVNASFAARTFVGTGTTTQFSISSNLTAESILVFENGVAQVPTIDYTYSGGLVTFTTAPAANVVIQVRELGIATPDGSANVINAIRNRDLQTNNLFPTDDGVYDLGTTGARYRNVYSSNTVTSSNIVSTVGVTTNIVTTNTIRTNAIITSSVQANNITANTVVSTTVQANTLIVKPSSVPYYATDYGVPGTIAWSNAYIYVCTATNTWTRATLSTWPAPPPPNIGYLVVGGGGGGGSRHGGGGGAGGFRAGTISGLSGSITVTVGAGGPGNSDTGTSTVGTSGSDSVFSNVTSSGGGAGGGSSPGGLTGGSGGGGGNGSVGQPAIAITPLPGETTSVQGYAGGSGASPFNQDYWGAGGGGAGGAGQNATEGKAGGAGANANITGANVIYACGGGGGAFQGLGAGGAGGDGGSNNINGGRGTGSNAGSNGATNTGTGGGGGGGATVGLNGGSGVVILSYPAEYSDLASVSAGLVCNGSAGNAVANTTLRAGYKIYQFTSGTGTISWGQ